MLDAAPQPHSALTPENPWPGVFAFIERDQDFFYGRTADAESLLAQVRRCEAVVLYGLSGLGKTSLLQAGLFPALRAVDMLPVRIRVGFEPDDGSVAAQVMSALRREFDRHQIGAPPWDGSQSLWEYFHRTDLEFWNPRNRRVCPVLVFDQFEEVFTVGQRDAETRARVEEVLGLLAEVLEHRPPDSVRERLDRDPRSGSQFDLRRAAVKIVVSLREDFLPQLDSWRARIPSLLLRRQRLEEMTEEQGMEVILGPGAHLVDETVARRILVLANDSERQRAAGRAVGAREIEPTLLSLVCERLNGERLRRKLPRITPELVDEIGERIVTHFYESAFVGLTAGVRAWVESSLVTSAGFRQSVELSDVSAERQAEVQTLIERHLLHREERKGGYWVELTHDRLTDPARRSRDARMAQEGIHNLLTAARQTATSLRYELTKPSEGGVDAALKAVSELERPLSEKAAIELRGWRSLCSSFAAEICVADARHDEAQQRAERALAGLEDLGAVESGDDPTRAYVLVARAEGQFVMGVIALDTGAFAEAGTRFAQTQATLGLVAQLPSVASEMAREAARLGVEVRLQMAALAEAVYDLATARSLCEEVLGIVRESGPGEVTAEDMARWSVEAWLVLARSQAHEPGHRRDKWLKQAWNMLEERLKADAGNLGLASLRVDVLLQWADVNASGHAAHGAEKVDQAAQTVAGFPVWFREAPLGAFPVVNTQIAVAEKLMERESWTEAEETLDGAEAILRAVGALRPGWLAHQGEVAWLSWHRAAFLHRRYLRSLANGSSSDDVEAVVSAYVATTALYRGLASRVPASSNRQRGLAICLGACAAAEHLVPRLEAARSRYREALAVLGALALPAYRALFVQSLIADYHRALADLAVASESWADQIASLDEAIRATLVMAEVSPEPKEHLQEAARLHRIAADRQQELKAPEQADLRYRSADELLVQAENSVARLRLGDGDAGSDNAGDAASAALTRIAGGLEWDRSSVPEEVLKEWRDEEVPLLLLRIELLRVRARGLAASAKSRAVEPLTMACKLALGAWELSRTDKVSDQIEALQAEVRSVIESLEPEGVNDGLRLTELIDRLSTMLRLDVDDTEGLMSAKMGIRVPSRPQNWELPPLIQGPWRTLARADQQAELKRTHPALVPLLIPERCLRIRTLALDCYDGASLFEAELSPVEGSTAPSLVVYLRRRNDVSLLRGESEPFHALNEGGALRLGSADRFVEYLSLFVNGIQGDEGRFIIIHHLDDLSWEPESPIALRQDVRKLIRPLVALADTDGGWTATGTVNYRDELFYARFQVSALGMVEMSSDDWCAKMLPIRVDEFQDGVRSILPRQALRSRRNLALRTRDWSTACISAQAWVDALVEGGRPRDKLGQEYRDLALIQIAAGDAAAALRTANIALEAVEDRAMFLAARAHALLFLGKIQEAEALYLGGEGERDAAIVKAVGEHTLKDWEWLSQMAEVSHPEMPRLRDRLQGRSN